MEKRGELEGWVRGVEKRGGKDGLDRVLLSTFH